MKDPYVVLRQKEADRARVRREIDALLTVIPLLAEPPRDRKSADTSAALREQSSNGLSELEVYYPFLRHSH